MQTLSQLHQQACAPLRLRFPILVLAIMCGCFFSPAASAQRDTGTISGTVQDPSHAVIPNANVILENNSTHDKRSTVSNGYEVLHLVRRIDGLEKRSANLFS